jgi:hypothetical protein
VKEGDHLEDKGVDGTVIFTMDAKEIQLEGIDWIHMAQDFDQWRFF